jgi:hypothetical protein
MTISHLELYPPEFTGYDKVTAEGKFLQLRWEGREYLLFARRDHYTYHSQMLGRFFQDHGLPYGWLDETRLDFLLPAFSVTGGGRFRYTASPPRLELWDDSHAYGRFDASGLADRLRESGHPFGCGEIIIG